MHLSATRFILLLLATICLSGYGQGTFLFRNRHFSQVDAPIFAATGEPLVGPDFRAELWGGVTPDSLAPAVRIFTGNQREIVPFNTEGYFSSLSIDLAIESVSPGEWAWLQVRAWDTRLGQTYEGVSALGLGGYGESSLFYAQSGVYFDLLSPPPPLIGLQSFGLRTVVPEPSSWALLALGGAFLGWATRRRPPPQ